MGEGVRGGMSADADCDVVLDGEAGRARVLGESGFGDGEAIRRRWRKGSRRCGEGAVSVTDGMVTSRKTAMTGISNFTYVIMYALKKKVPIHKRANLPSELSPRPSPKRAPRPTRST